MATRSTARPRAPGEAATWLVAAAVAVVLADSSVVTLGLPEVLRSFDADVADVAWVLTSFNLVLALAALPAAALVRRGGTTLLWRLGIGVFAAASLACALAPSLELLVAARCAQAVGGAAVVAAALVLLIDERGPAGGVRLWGAAGIVGAAIGPAVGGALTELLSWEAIFVVQVPLVLAIAAAPSTVGRVSSASLWRSPPLAAVAALALVSAALTAALFLLVIMLTEGWRRTPLQAAAIVSVMALAAVAAAPLSRLVGGRMRRAGAGAIALAGGLAALGLLPGASFGWTLAPQILIGLGLGLSISALGAHALDGVEDPLGRGAWTIAARHAGVVLGLLVLTPLFTADLAVQQDAAQQAGSAKLLDARLSPGLKIELAEAITERVERAGGRLPDLRPAFAQVDAPPESRAALVRLRDDLGDEVRRGATHAFSRSFLVAAAIALLALLPIALAAGGGAGGGGGLALLATTVAVAAALVGSYLALGGGDYRPPELRDPCQQRPWRDVEGLEAIGEQLSLSALDGAACRLRVTREELALALASADGRRRFLREQRISDETLADALRSGLLRAVADAARADALSPSQAALARGAIARLPIGTLIDIVRGGGELLGELRGGGNVLDALRGLLGALPARAG